MFKGWGAALALVLGTGLGSAAGQVRDGEVSSSAKANRPGWWNWSGAGEKAGDRKAPAKGEKGRVAEAAAAGQAPRADQTAAERAREQAKLLRRLAVCDQLRLIATQKKDDALLRQAEELDERVWAVYTHRVERLPAEPAADAPVEAKAGGAGKKETSGKGLLPLLPK